MSEYVERPGGRGARAEVPAGAQWNGAALSDPIENLHSAIADQPLRPRVLIVSEYELAEMVIMTPRGMSQYVMRSLGLGEWASERHRLTAQGLLRHELRKCRARKAHDFDVRRILERARALSE